MFARCSYLMHGGDEAATRRGHHDDCCDLLPAVHPLLYTAAATMRTLDPAIALLLLGRVRVDNDLQPLTAEQSQRAATQRLRFAALYPALAASASSKSKSQSQPKK